MVSSSSVIYCDTSPYSPSVVSVQLRFFPRDGLGQLFSVLCGVIKPNLGMRVLTAKEKTDLQLNSLQSVLKTFCPALM